MNINAPGQLTGVIPMQQEYNAAQQPFLQPRKQTLKEVLQDLTEIQLMDAHTLVNQEIARRRQEHAAAVQRAEDFERNFPKHLPKPQEPK